jgi:hypothetical protein
MATDNRPYQARRSRQCTRYTPLALGIHSLDSRAFQKKGGLVFSWMDTIQKKPQEMHISLRKKGAFLSKNPVPMPVRAGTGMSFFLFNATGALKMRLDASLIRLTGHNTRNFKDSRSGYGQPSRIKYA